MCAGPPSRAERAVERGILLRAHTVTSMRRGCGVGSLAEGLAPCAKRRGFMGEYPTRTTRRFRVRSKWMNLRGRTTSLQVR